MMIRQVVSRGSRSLTQQSVQRRSMGGGPFPYNLNVKKNKFVEEWNGRREITEKSFEANGKTVPWIVFLTVVVPYGIYAVARDELSKTGGRRYKDMC